MCSDFPFVVFFLSGFKWHFPGDKWSCTSFLVITGHSYIFFGEVFWSFFNWAVLFLLSCRTSLNVPNTNLYELHLLLGEAVCHGPWVSLCIYSDYTKKERPAQTISQRCVCNELPWEMVRSPCRQWPDLLLFSIQLVSPPSIVSYIAIHCMYRHSSGSPVMPLWDLVGWGPVEA